jgi:hypothetical protein
MFAQQPAVSILAIIILAALNVLAEFTIPVVQCVAHRAVDSMFVTIRVSVSDANAPSAKTTGIVSL